MNNPAVLHMLCGKIAAGKSTLAAQLRDDANTILLSQDFLMSSLYPEMQNFDDYLHRAPMLRNAIRPLCIEILKKGISLVLDFPANTQQSRNWMRGIFEEAKANHILHYLNAPEDVCLKRLLERNQGGAHEYKVSGKEFAEISARFEEPSRAEGLFIKLYY